MTNSFLSPPQVADEFPGLSERWLARRRQEGAGPRYIKVGMRVLYARADLLAYLDAHAVNGGGRDV